MCLSRDSSQPCGHGQYQHPGRSHGNGNSFLRAFESDEGEGAAWHASHVPFNRRNVKLYRSHKPRLGNGYWCGETSSMWDIETFE